MRNRNARNRHELKKARESRRVVIGMITSLVIFTVVYLYMVWPKTTLPPISTATTEQEIENYIRDKTTDKQVAEGCEPVILYYRHPDWTQDQFCCVGTVIADKEYGTMVLTAEHVFTSSITNRQIISFKPLRRNVNVQKMYFNKIVKTSKELSGNDALLATFGTVPIELPPFSQFKNHSDTKHAYGDVVVGKRTISSVTSLVSGEKFRTLGYQRRLTEPTNQIFVLIECNTRVGESGTGFIDDYGGLWVLHGGPDSDAMRDLVIREYEELVHKKAAGFASISGPFGGKYE